MKSQNSPCQLRFCGREALTVFVLFETKMEAECCSAVKNNSHFVALQQMFAQTETLFPLNVDKVKTRP